MSGELSPDGNYYWNGVEWIRAITPDGAWRWDGRAWRPAGRRTRPGARTAAVIASGVVVALLVVGLGMFGISRLFINAQRNLQSSLSPTCSAGATAGAHVAEGDTLCGRQLGASLIAADCTRMTSLPSDLTADELATPTADWTPTDVGLDSTGCQMVAQPDQDVEIRSAATTEPDVVVVADFVPIDQSGGVGLRLGCTQEGSCIDVTIYSDESFSLDEGVPNADWKNLKQGGLALGYMRFGQPNRLILRFAGGDAYVYLNGYEVARATPDIAQQSGYAGFYVDDQQSTKSERVQLRQIYVFQAL
jgi:hypothetical protein